MSVSREDGDLFEHFNHVCDERKCVFSPTRDKNSEVSNKVGNRKSLSDRPLPTLVDRLKTVRSFAREFSTP